MIPAQSYYQRFQISPTATHEEIRTAYRQLVFKYHPDRHGENSSNTRIIQEINEVYEILSDPYKRGLYDQSLEPEKVRGPEKQADQNKTSKSTKFPYRILLVIFFIVFKFLCNTEPPAYKQGTFSVHFDTNDNRSLFYVDSTIKLVRFRDSFNIIKFNTK